MELNHTFYKVEIDFIVNNPQLIGLAQVTQKELVPFRLYCYFTINVAKNTAIVDSFELWIEPGLFRHWMETKGYFPKEYEILELLDRSSQLCLGTRTALEYLHKTPIERKGDQKHPEISHWNSDLPLMAHQIDSYWWMQDIENRIKHQQCCLEIETDAISLANTGWCYNYRQKCLTKCIPKGGEISYQGGILADVTGSGKTSIVLACIASSLETAVELPPIFQGQYVPSNATLVVTPYNLPQQWKHEIEKFLPDAGLKVLPVYTQYQFQNASLEKLQTSDIVLTTMTFLASKKYQATVRQQIASILELDVTAVTKQTSGQLLKIAGRKLQTLGKTLEGWCPIELMYFKRIVIDEAHELFRPRMKLIPSLTGGVYWAVTGTPDIGSSGLLDKFCDLIHCRPPHWSPRFCIEIVKHCFHHYQEINFGSVKEIIHWVTLSPMEKQLVDTYSGKGIEAQIKVGTYFNIVNTGNLSKGSQIRLLEIEKILEIVEKQHKNSMRQTKQKIHRKQASIQSTQNHIARDSKEMKYLENELYIAQTNNNDPDRIAELTDEIEYFSNTVKQQERRLERHFQKLDELKQSLHNLNSRLSYFTEIMEHVQSDNKEETCPICMDTIGKTITNCGHIYCHACISHAIRQKPECPICKSRLTSKAIHIIKTETSQQDNIRRYGTKFTKVIELLTGIVERKEKVVIFGQWLGIVLALRTILLEQEFNVLAVVGNTSTRCNAVKKFLKGKLDALILCLDNSASGLDLGIANHVIFMHSIFGTERQVKLLKQQAIARVNRLNQTKPVTVHFIAAENSIEKELLQ